MATNRGMLHELWEYLEEGIDLTFCHAGPKGDGARRTVPEGAKLIWTVWATSHFEAMTRYYERQGWGVYHTDHTCDLEPYPTEWLQEQQQFLALSSPKEREA